MTELKPKGAPRGPRPRKDNIGLIIEAGQLLRRAIEGNMVAVVGRYLLPENIAKLDRLKEELKAAAKACNGALHGFEHALGQLQQMAEMKAKMAELERQNQLMAERLSTAGHSDAIPAPIRKGPGRPKQLPQTEMTAA